MLYLLFFASGASALIYEVIWVRVFANVFGNTIYSASIVTAVFMLGLGVGSYATGHVADRRYASRPDSMLRIFAGFEGAMGLLGVCVSLLLPHLSDLSAAVSAYTRGPNGWYALSIGSYAARAAIAVTLLTPPTMLMGGTLALLIRHVVRGLPTMTTWKIALLYGVNTIGAAAGCFLTDFSLVPSFGLRATQLTAVAINLATASGALLIKSRIGEPESQVATTARRTRSTRTGNADARTTNFGSRIPPFDELRAPRGSRAADPRSRPPTVSTTAAVLAITGFAGLGMEILWFRHFSILLGEFRAVFSMLLTVILLAMGAGSLAGAYVQKRARDAATVLIVVQGLFVAAVLAGLASVSARTINDAATQYASSTAPTTAADIWFNLRPIVLVVGLPAALLGFAFPLANSIVQRLESTVGRRAGALYLANTVGAVCGSLVTGFVLLPSLGMQQSATVIAIVATLAIVPLVHLTTVPARSSGTWLTRSSVAAVAIAAVAIGWWVVLPRDYLLSRALLFAPQRAYAISEGVTELVAITDGPDGGRVLVTNGHPMSSTELLSQRYMRAMAHIPLLAMDNPQRVLVLCFGVGNTAHAATLHPTVTQVDVVDLSRHILSHADYFKEFNGDVLRDPRVTVYVNDGRHHLQMKADLQTRPYDLITLEPPPIVHAGVAALYTREFYQRARARLTSHGYISQWLPAFGVPHSMILSMVRSFIDVFPNAVLLSGAGANLLLVGTNAATNQIDVSHLTRALEHAPEVRTDLQRLDLATPTEIVGMFVASARTLERATRGVQAVTDDRPIQEYARRSLLEGNEGIPPSLVAVKDVSSWCPSCFASGKPVPQVESLNTYLSVLELAYTAPSIGPAQTVATGADRRPIAGSGYLGAVVPASSSLNAILNAAFVERYQHGTDLLVARKYPDAIDEFNSALRWNSESVEAHNNLGIALASAGRMDEAVDQFKEALAIDPGFEDARRNLATATRR